MYLLQPLTPGFLLTAAGLVRLTGAATIPQLVYQYDTPTWIENFAVRQDGSILPARATSAVLTELDLRSGHADVVSNQSSVGSAIMGITKVTPDLFAMSTMYCDLSTLSCTAGSGTTWAVDFRHAKDGTAARVRKLVEGPDGKSLLNGMAGLNERMTLMVDQALGGIWAVDVVDGGATLVIQDKAMEDPKQQGNGVNGIRVRKGTLYFNNPSRGTFGSVPIDMRSGRKTGHVRVLATALELDDFEVDEERGIAYVTTGPENALIGLNLATGSHHVVARGLPGPTSARWADQDQHRCTLYVSTTGGYPQWLSGSAIVGGAIYKVEV